MKIQSIQVGKIQSIQHLGREVTTAIFKTAVTGPVLLKTLSLEGDQQADLRVHGGTNKALYAYGLDAYPKWRELRPEDDFANGAMGENLTMSSLPEDQICVGDSFRLGEAIVQVTEPRFPCHKLGLKFKDLSILNQFMALGRPGVYFRVIKEGLIAEGDELTALDREKVRFSILDFFNFKRGVVPEKTLLREVIKIEALPNDWRTKFQNLLKDLA